MYRFHGNGQKEPNKHTFIFIKGKLRCSKTLCKDHIGVLYERRSKNKLGFYYSGIGRTLTGYHKNTNSIVFTDIKQIIKYKHFGIISSFKITIHKTHKTQTTLKTHKTIKKHTIQTHAINTIFSTYNNNTLYFKSNNSQQHTTQHYTTQYFFIILNNYLFFCSWFHMILMYSINRYILNDAP